MDSCWLGKSCLHHNVSLSPQRAPLTTTCPSHHNVPLSPQRAPLTTSCPSHHKLSTNGFLLITKYHCVRDHHQHPCHVLDDLCILYSAAAPPQSIIAMIAFTGVKILFRVALVLLKHSTNHLDKIPNDFYDLLNCLKTRNMPPHILQPDFLLEEVRVRAGPGASLDTVDRIRFILDSGSSTKSHTAMPNANCQRWPFGNF